MCVKWKEEFLILLAYWTPRRCVPRRNKWVEDFTVAKISRETDAIRAIANVSHSSQSCQAQYECTCPFFTVCSFDWTLGWVENSKSFSSVKWCQMEKVSNILVISSDLWSSRTKGMLCCYRSPHKILLFYCSALFNHIWCCFGTQLLLVASLLDLKLFSNLLKEAAKKNQPSGSRRNRRQNIILYMRRRSPVAAPLQNWNHSPDRIPSFLQTKL